MLEKLIKKMHKRVAFSVYGILEIVVLLLPLVVIAFGIYFQVTAKEHGVLWIVVGVACLLFSFRKFKDLFGIYKYIFSTNKYPLLAHLKEDGVDTNEFDQELEEAMVDKKLSKNNPVVMTKSFIFGYSQVSFFAVLKKDVLWAYEYNGNGIVFYDKYKSYGFTYYPNVDGNDQLMETLKVEMPYIYLGTDFDYKAVMHDNFDETVINVQNERLEFISDPEGYRFKKAEEERIRIEEETRKLEEAKNKELEEIESNSEFKDEEQSQIEEVKEENETQNKEENE